jgi:hypothetical protein
MAQKASRPVTSREGADLGFETVFPTVSDPIPTAKPYRLQENWIAARFRLGAHHARVVADLHFGQEARS